MTEPSPVSDIADAYLEALAPHEPAAAQTLGRGDSAALPDLTPEWYVERHELDARTAASLAAASPAAGHSSPESPRESGLAAALSERLASYRSLFDTGFTSRLLAPLATPVHLVRESFEGIVVTDDDVIARLESAPQALRDYERTLRWSRDNDASFSGTGVAAATQVAAVADQVSTWIDPTGTDFYRSLPLAPTLSEAQVRRFRDAADAASLASERLVQFLRNDLLPTAPTTDAVGEEVYSATARSFLGTELDLDEVYDYGWSELHRLVDESRALARGLGATGDNPVRSAAARLDADPAVQLDGVEGIQRWLTTRVEDTIVALDGTAFDLPSNLREVDCIVSEAAAGVVYYSPAAPDGSSRSKIVWTVPNGEEAPTTWREVTSVHHEGVPGHHFEHSVNRANTSLHPWQRSMVEIHGYAEGWAHYSEGLSDELGLIRDEAERLGMLLGQIWRSVRIVADIGLHTGRGIPRTSLTDETTWSPELARRFLRDFSLTDARTAKFEVDRYLGWPGQALAFKVGAKLWQEARAQSAAARGSAFTLKGFHADALALGPMGLGPLRERLLAS